MHIGFKIHHLSSPAHLLTPASAMAHVIHALHIGELVVALQPPDPGSAADWTLHGSTKLRDDMAIWTHSFAVSKVAPNTVGKTYIWKVWITGLGCIPFDARNIPHTPLFQRENMEPKILKHDRPNPPTNIQTTSRMSILRSNSRSAIM